MSTVGNSLAGYTTLPIPILSDYPRWYAVYTYPRHEKAVAQQLESKSIEVFFPTLFMESRWKDRRVRIQTPAFPGYVFTRINLSQRSKVLNAPGAIRMLSFNGTPAPIDDSEIEAIKLCLESGVVLEPTSCLEVGDRVRVRSGVLEGLEGLISRRKNERRLVVPITLINQSVAIEIDVQLLEPISRNQPNQRHRSSNQLGNIVIPSNKI